MRQSWGVGGMSDVAGGDLRWFGRGGLLGSRISDTARRETMVCCVEKKKFSKMPGNSQFPNFPLE